jgi:molybdopterin adenylyltransferase
VARPNRLGRSKPHPPEKPHRLRPPAPPVEAEKKKRKMSSSTAEPRALTAAVVTVSDSCARGERTDLSGPAVAQLLEKLHFDVVAREVVPDDTIQIQNLLIRLSREARFVVTTGGTGIALRDVTPEATVAVCDRLLEGVAERMRSEGTKKTPYAALSRAVCAVRGRSLILNLPGSPAGAVQSLEAVAALIPHAVDLLSGRTEHR